MDMKLWRGESIDGILKLPRPLVLMQQVPVQLRSTPATVPTAHIGSAPEALQSRTSPVGPSKQDGRATFSLQCCLFPKAVEKKILCVVLTQASQTSWLKLDQYRGGKPVQIMVAYLVGNLSRQSQPHGSRVLSS